MSSNDEHASSVAYIAMLVFALLGPGFFFSGLSHLVGALPSFSAVIIPFMT